MCEKDFIDKVLNIEDGLGVLIEHLIAEGVNYQLIKEAAELHRQIYGALSERVGSDIQNEWGGDDSYRRRTLEKMFDLQTFKVKEGKIVPFKK